MTDVFIKWGNWQADSHRENATCSWRWRWGDASTSQGTRKIVSKPLGAQGKVWSRCSFRASEGTDSGDALALDVQPPELWDKTFLLFKSLSLMYFVRQPKEMYTVSFVDSVTSFHNSAGSLFLLWSFLLLLLHSSLCCQAAFQNLPASPSLAYL